MVKIALLLIGGNAFRGRFWLPVLAGLFFVAAGFAIIGNVASGLVPLATKLFGTIFLIQGFVSLIEAFSRRTLAGVAFSLVKALFLFVLGAVIVWQPVRSEMFLTWLFAFGFAAHALSRLASMAAVRFDRWWRDVAPGVLELLFAGLILLDWPLPHHLNIPLCISILLVLLGVAIIRLALALRQDPDTMTLLLMPMFTARGWNENAPVLIDDDEEGDWEQGQMRILIWTPVKSAKVSRRVPIFDRYFGAFDENGELSTGHAALEFQPDLYISHWPLEEIDQSKRITQLFDAGAHNDIAGQFQPSYDVERTLWGCDADQAIEFSRFHARRLRAYWAGYRQLTAYNLTNRNCSIAVAGALDAALEGALDCRRPWLRLAVLLLNPALWEAAYIRSQARHLCWTPGLVLDYAAALKRIVEPERMAWFAGLARGARSPITQSPRRGFLR